MCDSSRPAAVAGSLRHGVWPSTATVPSTHSSGVWRGWDWLMWVSHPGLPAGLCCPGHVPADPPCPHPINHCSRSVGASENHRGSLCPLGCVCSLPVCTCVWNRERMTGGGILRNDLAASFHTLVTPGLDTWAFRIADPLSSWKVSVAGTGLCPDVYPVYTA